MQKWRTWPKWIGYGLLGTIGGFGSLLPLVILDWINLNLFNSILIYGWPVLVVPFYPLFLFGGGIVFGRWRKSWRWALGGEL